MPDTGSAIKRAEAFAEVVQHFRRQRPQSGDDPHRAFDLSFFGEPATGIQVVVADGLIDLLQ